MHKTRIPTIIAIVFLVVGLAAGVFLVQQRQTFRLGAAPEFAPKDLRVTNISDNSFVVSWYTDSNSAGFIDYGNNPNSLSERVFQENSSPKRVHYITVNDLKPDTNYYFTVNSGDETYDNSGVPWSVRTGPILEPKPSSLVLSGQVFSNLDTPATGIAVYAQIGGAQLISTQTSSNGNFVLPLGNVRNQLLDGYVSIDRSETLIQLIIQGGPLGTAYVQTYASNANPTPKIILGQSYDLRRRNLNEKSLLPEATIELPGEDSDSSQFLID